MMSDQDPFRSAWRALWPKAHPRDGESEEQRPAAAPAQAAEPAQTEREPVSVPAFLDLSATADPSGQPQPETAAERRPDPPPVARALDESIPLLTEIVELPQPAEEALPESLAQVDWSRLALQVREQVLDDLLRQPERLLDEPLRERVQRVVERATRALALELRATVEETVREAIAVAVAEELTRIQAEILYRGDATRVPDPNDQN